MININDKVFVRDPFILTESMLPLATVIDFDPNYDLFLLIWDNGLRHWFHRTALKKE